MQHLNRVVWSTTLGLPGRCGVCIHRHSPNGAMRGRGLTSLAVGNNDRFCDIRKEIATIRSEI